MTVNIWTPTADNVAQVSTYTPLAADRVATVTIGSVAYTTGVEATLAAMIDALVLLFNNSSHPYYTGITASNSGDTAIVLTGDTPGVPFTATIVADASGTPSTNVAPSTIAADGLAHWDQKLNWRDEDGAVLGAAPTSGVCLFDDTDQGVLYGIGGADNCTIITGDNFTGCIGLQERSFCTDVSGSSFSDVAEYRALLSFSGFATGSYQLSGDPKYISFGFDLANNDIPTVVCKVNSTNAASGNQNRNVEIRIDEDAGAAAQTPTWYCQSGGLVIKNQEITNYDVVIGLVVDDCDLILDDNGQANAKRRFGDVYLNDGSLDTEGAVINDLYVTGGQYTPTELWLNGDLYLDGGIVDLTSVERVELNSSAFALKNGELRTANATPAIAPATCTVYHDDTNKLRVVFSKSFKPATLQVSGTFAKTKTYSFRRL